MPGDFNTTFIPKKVDIPSEVKKTAQDLNVQKGLDLLSIIAYLMIIVTLVSFLYVFYKRSVVINDVAAMQAKINEKASVFDDELLDEVSQMSKKVALANNLVSRHTTYSMLFYVLPQIFLPEVRVNGLTIKEGATIKMDENVFSEAEILGNIDTERDIMISGSMYVTDPEVVVKQRDVLRGMGFVKYFDVPSPGFGKDKRSDTDDISVAFTIVVDGEFANTFNYMSGEFGSVRKIEDVFKDGGDNVSD